MNTHTHKCSPLLYKNTLLKFLKKYLISAQSWFTKYSFCRHQFQCATPGGTCVHTYVQYLLLLLRTLQATTLFVYSFMPHYIHFVLKFQAQISSLLTKPGQVGWQVWCYLGQPYLASYKVWISDYTTLGWCQPGSLPYCQVTQWLNQVGLSNIHQWEVSLLIMQRGILLKAQLWSPGLVGEGTGGAGCYEDIQR